MKRMRCCVLTLSSTFAAMDPETVFTGVFLITLMAVNDTTEAMSGTTGPVYTFVNIPKTWSEAQSYCRVNYDDLATVDSMTQNGEVVGSMGNAGVSRIWIGLEKRETEWWVWSEGIGEVTVFKWNVAKHYGDCVLMKPDGFWYGEQCSELRASLCFELDSMGNETYILNTELLSWRDAQTYCRKHHIDLVSVKTKTQNKEVHVQGSGHTIWIGLIREAWTWSNRGTGSFRNWWKDSPDNALGSENCAAIREALQYQWDDLTCSNRYPFVCQGEKKIKRTVIKLRLSSGVNLSLPAESDSLLKQIQAQLEERGAIEVKTRWLTIKKEQTFRRKQDNATKTTCP